jgi:hypothetical protein
MLMFNYGILATFIPEILMVIGFLLSIIIPNLNSQNTTPPVNAQTIYLNTTEHSVDSKSYVVSNFDFQQVVQQEDITSPSISYPTTIPSVVGSDKYFLVSDGLCFVQFSRPPPSFLS